MSAFNFGLNLALLKWWSSEHFGIYSLVFAISFMLISLQNALINTPYAVLVPSSKKPTQIRQHLAQANVLLTTVLTLATIMIAPWFTATAELATATSAYLVSRLIREYLRSRWASELNLMPILITDLVQVVLFVGACGWVVTTADLQHLRLTTVLWFIALSQVAASSLMLISEWRLLRQSRWQTLLPGYKPIWVQARWSLIGAITTELQNRGYVIFVGAIFGATLVGFIQAGRVFFGPLNVITSAWTRVAKPTLARFHGEGQQTEFFRLTHLGAIGFLTFNVAFGLALWAAWPWLSTYLFENKYLNIEVVVIQWALVTLIFHVRSSYSTAVQAQNRFKELAWATIWGSLLSALILLIIAWIHSPNLVISGIIIAEAFVLAYTLKLVSNSRKMISSQGAQC